MPTAGAWSWLDKPVHALLFAVHCGLLTRALSGAKGRDGELVVAALVSGCYAVLLEVAQIWVPRRSWEWWDLVAGFAGIAVVALLIGRRRARLRATF